MFASLIGLYKNNGAVSCVGNYFPFSSNFTLVYRMGLPLI